MQDVLCAATHITLRGAAARGALTFSELTRVDNAINLIIVWAKKTKRQKDKMTKRQKDKKTKRQYTGLRRSK